LPLFVVVDPLLAVTVEFVTAPWFDAVDHDVEFAESVDVSS
jgi:hypothetical protein